MPHLNMVDGREYPSEEFSRNFRDADIVHSSWGGVKCHMIDTFQLENVKCGVTGDGMGDCSALALAHCGIAFYFATEGARSAADVILLEEGVDMIEIAWKMARCIMGRIRSCITHRMAIHSHLGLFLFISLFAFDPSTYQANFPRYFTFPMIYVILMRFVVDFFSLSTGWDRVKKIQDFDTCHMSHVMSWIIPHVIVSTVASLLWLYLCLTSRDTLKNFEVEEMKYGNVVNAVFLQISLSEILQNFSVRTQEKFFFQRNPHFSVAILAGICLLLGTVMGTFWAEGVLEGIEIGGLAHGNGMMVWWTWVYCIIAFVIEDLVKVTAFWMKKKFDCSQLN
eukprot:TRINITY_DN6982_c0_g1_i2.p2 TRINITY_DN6982_c0_g1~~TRINITY_DN6982_c0_g1_i2.p2  ORF type:complete len:337 (-),score=95.12 TRINITY_DN6982_c0_g1_i2:68-1078(-)